MAFAGRNPSDEEVRRLLARPAPPPWPVLRVTIGAVSAGLFASFVVQVFGLLGPMVRDTGDQTRYLTGEYPSPLLGLALAVLPAQAVFLIAAVGAGSQAVEGWRERLGLTRGRAPLWAAPIFMAGAVGILLTLGVLAWAVFKHPLGAAERFGAAVRDAGDPLSVVLLFLMSAVRPAVADELLFRGYAQRALVARWGPAAGIAITSLLFAAAHLEPQRMAVIFFSGVFLGIVAWRTDSVWPSMACHMASNATVMAVGLFAAAGRPWPMAWGVVVWACSAAALCASVVLLVRMKPGGPGVVAAAGP